MARCLLRSYGSMGSTYCVFSYRCWVDALWWPLASVSDGAVNQWTWRLKSPLRQRLIWFSLRCYFRLFSSLPDQSCAEIPKPFFAPQHSAFWSQEVIFCGCEASLWEFGRLPKVGSLYQVYRYWGGAYGASLQQGQKMPTGHAASTNKSTLLFEPPRRSCLVIFSFLQPFSVFSPFACIFLRVQLTRVVLGGSAYVCVLLLRRRRAKEPAICGSESALSGSSRL